MITRSLFKRMTLLLSTMLACLTACNHVAYSHGADKDLAYKYKGIYGVRLRIDSLTRHEYVTITNENERYIASPSLVAKGGGGGSITTTVVDFPSPKPST